MDSVVKLLKNKYAPFFFAVPIFFCLYRYSGIVMDAVLYLTQYVYSVDPARFLGDPAFEFGNQDSLGFFSPILGLFIRSLGANKGMFVFTVLMQLGWLIAVVFMVKSLARLMRNRLWALPISIAMALIFANGMPIERIRFFHLVECYACSRSLSIDMGIAGLALLFANRRWLSLLLILFGTAIHPLTAGWCLPLWLIYFYPKTRWLIAVGAALFPLSFLLHVGRFDVYASDWMLRPLEYTPSYAIVGRFLMLIVFWGVVVKAFTQNFFVRKLAIAMTFVMFIALYWDFWGGFGEHVLLYQSQPWRAIWLGSLVAVPVYLVFLKNTIARIRKERNMTIRDLALVFVGLNIISPQCLVIVSFLIVVLLKMKMKSMSINVNTFMYVFLGFVILGLFAQQYHIWCLQGFKPVFGYSFYAMCHMRDAALYGQFCFCVAFIIYFLRRRNFIIPLILFAYCIFPQFQIIPLLAIFMALSSKKDKKYWVRFSLLLAVVIMDAIFNSDLRLHKLVNGLPSNSLWAVVIMVLAAGTIYFRRYSVFPIVVLLGVCGVIACGTYDDRGKEKQDAELALDGYLEQTIFPQVKERGRILFYVDGFHQYEPRLQFLTGSYLSLSAHVGTLFNRNHYLEIKHRYEQINNAAVNESVFSGAAYQSIVSSIFSNPDSLSKKVNFLCENREITNLITTTAVKSFDKLDSTTISNGMKVYLYSCP